MYKICIHFVYSQIRFVINNKCVVRKETWYKTQEKVLMIIKKT